MLNNGISLCTEAETDLYSYAVALLFSSTFVASGSRPIPASGQLLALCLSRRPWGVVTAEAAGELASIVRVNVRIVLPAKRTYTRNGC